MHEVLQEIQNKGCTACGLCARTRNVCQMPQIDEPRDRIMIVGDYPSTTDMERDTVMQSYKERALRKVMGDGIIEGSKLHYFYPTYAVKCSDSDTRKPPTSKEIAACRPYLQQEIDFVKPRVIIALGKTAMDSLGISGKITEKRGQEFSYTTPDGFTTKVIVAYSPSYVEQAQNAFPTFVRDINKAFNIWRGAEVTQEFTKVKIINTVPEIKEVVEYCKQTGIVAFDYETTELDDNQGTHAEGFKATALSLSFQHGSAYVIPLQHFEKPRSLENTQKIIGYISKELFMNPEVRKVAHNIKFDMGVTAFYGFPLFRGRIDDTMLMHHLDDETTRHGLKVILPQYYPKVAGYDDEIQRYKWEEVPLKPLCKYNGTDTDYTLRLCAILEGKLLKDPQVYNVYRNQVMFATRPLFEAEHNGMLIDRAKLLKYQKRAKELLEQQEQILLSYPQLKQFQNHMRVLAVAEEVNRLEKMKLNQKGKHVTNTEERIAKVKSGAIVMYDGFNLSSSDQVGDFLYSEVGLGYPLPKVRVQGVGWVNKRSTDAKIIKRFPDPTGFIKELLVYRTLEKNIGTYIDGLLRQMDENDRVHTSYLQHGTETGRLSSRSPNLQNIPKHVKVDSDIVREVVAMITDLFTVPEGHTLLAVDFSQAELRIIAELAGETNMIRAYNSGQDLHTLTASIVSGIPIDELMAMKKTDKDRFDDLRFKAKAVNFGYIYGQQPEGFVEYAEATYGVKITLQEAKLMRQRFFAAYPRLEVYHREYIALGKKQGFVRTMMGRKRHVPNINSDNFRKASDDERVAINSPVQGSCGEATIFAIALLRWRLPESVKLANTVHDSIMYYVPNHLVPYVQKVLVETCEDLPIKQVFGRGMEQLKLKVDVQFSQKSWKKLEDYSPEKWEETMAA